ncbi:glycoside hydrolase family 30 protein [Magnetospirillum fulvum]|uniref:O-glycosyl hydrolase 30 family protein n=1 Tax=Magnetospirillum fulvum MGU-K5 TaxID=1316936 RepID=S9S6K6_MAGFU|nr:glycoside hydrolase family 30 beta sandwich domain-containing protein [Magnetospirillum fulvum]EPY01497.1 O-glycosyl hydrolase 30 family protein [Magnetospirillum fulvum MGU-K5]
MPIEKSSTAKIQRSDQRLTTWITSGDRRFLLSEQSGPVPGSASLPTTPIKIDTGKAYQPVRGFGFSLTGGSALLISRLEPALRMTLLRELFSPEGIGISCLRLTMGASDLSPCAFSYDDLPEGSRDPNLEQFDLFAGDPDLVPVLQDIVKINPDLFIMASPWSAPAWMKTNGRFIGGELKPECHDVYARYFVRYLAAMREQGINIRAITVQNEPGNEKNDPSMVMGAEQMAEFIGQFLGPALRQAGLETEIYCHDHNCDRPDYPLAVLADPSANRYTRGAAFHLYGGDISAMTQIHDRHPDKSCLFTEQWVSVHDSFEGALMWHSERVLVGALRNWAEIVLEWNLASDPTCNPHTPGGEKNCLGALTLDGQTVTRNVAYYLIAHTAKFIPPGSRRVESDQNAILPNAAFLTPDGQIVVIAVNTDDTPRRLTLSDAGHGSAPYPVDLPAKSLVTCVWELPPGLAS